MQHRRIFILSDYIFVLIGTLIIALALNIFLVPNKVSVGGVTSIGTVLLYIFGFPLSFTNLAANLMLLILGFSCLGKSALIKNIFGIAALSVFLEITSYLPAYTEDTFLAGLSGGAIMGLGLGIVIRRGASTGGTDFISVILNRLFPHISIARIILFIDGIIIAFAGIVFGSITITLYSAISLFVCSKVADGILTLGYSAKSVYIITTEHKEIFRIIIEEFQRGVTGIKSRGMYSDSEKLMLMCIISAKELPTLTKRIREIDNNSFLIISDVREVLGEGFKRKIEYD